MKITKTNSLKLISSILLLYFSTSAHADICLPTGLYLGAFIGGGKSLSANATQRGVAFFDADAGGPLSVTASGDSDSTFTRFGGIHIGLRGNTGQLGGLCLTPAAEVEAFYLNNNDPKFTVIDTNSRVTNHTFDDSLPMDTGVLLANGVVNFNLPNICRVHPYLGAGFGAARISVRDADSPQVNPPEPNVNHFNSDPDATDTAFAAQAKAGINFDLTNHLKMFVEYRYLYIASTDYTFGSTVYPTHAATTNWNVHVGQQGYNLADVGFQYAL